jgi:hypothetical protein
MTDDEPFTQFRDKPYIIIAEVKTTLCNLNGPWTDPEKGNLPSVLHAIGAYRKEDIKTVSDTIYRFGAYSNGAYCLTLACFGGVPNCKIGSKYPTVPQILWDRVLGFIYGRFAKYKDQKASHDQWDAAGKSLWDCFRRNHSPEKFKAAVRFGSRENAKGPPQSSGDTLRDSLKTLPGS